MDEKKSSHWIDKLKEFDVLFPLIIGLSDIASLLTTILGVIYHKNEPAVWAAFSVLALLVITSGVAAIVYYRKYRHSKREIVRIQNENLEKDQLLVRSNTALTNYKSSFKYLNGAFDNIHKPLRVEPKTKDEFLHYFITFCNSFSEAFTRTTGTTCTTCIKITAWITEAEYRSVPKNSLEVITLARDPKNIRERTIGDRKIQHLIKENTDFDTIFKHINTEKGRVFFDNALPKRKAYANSSFKKVGFDTATPFKYHQNWEEKVKQWKLPYKSCIVAPICPGIDEVDLNQRQSLLQGFLCIDAEDMNVFDPLVHPEIVVGSADALYNTVKLFKDKFYKQN